MSDQQTQNNLQCPNEEVWFGYLEGTLDKERQQQMENHLLSCPTCRHTLVMVIKLVQPEISDEEQQELERLELAALTEQAKQLQARPAQIRPATIRPLTKPWVLRHWRIAASLLAAVALSALVWALLGNHSELDQGMQALRQAYTDERLLQARLTGGFPYAPYHAERNAASATGNQTALALAEQLLKSAVAKTNSAAAHHALGRYYLLSRQPEQALSALTQALSQQPTSAEIQCDIGVAYMQRADLSGALRAFDQALAHNPRLPEALFNRALCLQLLSRWSDARAAWQQYLAVDWSSAWAEEARQHLSAIPRH
ncbi:MAG: zf-HC2 domain-containing protein [Acidobacteriota bacterium]|nr:zf-HC2 domain-containing protein [Blastocatellia bacterium]MDW8239060.1 zf-HC2 domain-containing protein [Acidobacteriota bacterium]